MLNKELIKVLSKIYRYENSKYDPEKKIDVYRHTDQLAPQQQEHLEASNFEPNRITKYEHNEVVNELKNIIENHNLEYMVSNLFIKAVGAGFNRGIQPIFSYYFAKNMPLHDFKPCSANVLEQNNVCRVCGIQDTVWSNDSKNLYDLYIGYCRFGGYSEILLDLKEILTFEGVIATDDEKNTFLEVLDIIEKAPRDETPSGLLKRLSKERCLPKSNNISRTWIVKCMAELGILRNSYDNDYSIMNAFVPYEQKLEWELNIHKSSLPRADVEFPISSWQGELGINRALANKIIDNASK
ncbi:hypothetical protein K1F50_19785 [Muricauda oceani]|uniref:Uncharacterized protein n=1 Tax=Flagellimonas oceani TaxID=2698672 RepID=A0A6G7J1X3_9FLAO|nr:hypothetical protein [Allomuricauda oceani]MBW8245056.1 hypothetical protein [Allomuricauda oceani]QII44871.1 hypothetical protein GVT53_09305 [Allomuricauda oceani]